MDKNDKNEFKKYYVENYNRIANQFYTKYNEGVGPEGNEKKMIYESKKSKWDKKKADEAKAAAEAEAKKKIEEAKAKADAKAKAKAEAKAKAKAEAEEAKGGGEPVLEIYEYLLDGYPKKNYKTYAGEIKDVNKGECGLGKHTHKDYWRTDKKYRSCDLFNFKFNDDDYDKNVKAFDKIFSGGSNSYPTLRELIEHYFKYPAKTKYFFEVHDHFKIPDINNKYNIKKYINKIKDIYLKNINDKFFNPPVNFENDLKSDDDKVVIQNENKRGYILKLEIDDKKKVLIMGDLHGSIHTLLRNLYRLQIIGKFKGHSNWKIDDDLYLIFLGDLIDRGAYGYDIIAIALMLKDANPNKVFINRGNHEEWSNLKKDFYGISNKDIEREKESYSMPWYELKKPEKKIFTQGVYNSDIDKNLDALYNKLSAFFCYCPSAIIIKNKEKKDDKWIWLCHGGVPFISNNFFEKTKNRFNNFLNEKGKTHYYTDEDISHNIRWNDFHVTKDTEDKEKNGEKMNRILIGTDYLKKFTDGFNIKYVIRAHQDQSRNTKLLIGKCVTNDYDSTENGLTDLMELRELNKIENNSQNIYHITKSRDDTKDARNNYLFRLFINEFKDNQMVGDCKFYPVVTLSTNTGYDRHLDRDSFAILRHDLNNISRTDDNNGFITK